MSLPRKIFLVSFLLLIFLSLVPKIIYAQEKGRNISDYGLEDYNNDNRVRTDEAKKGETIIEGSGVTVFQSNAALAGFANMIICTDENPKYCNPQKTAMGIVTLAMASLYQNPPASFAWYLHDVLASAGLAKPAYAQGIGFAVLSSLLPIWKASRNVAYTVLIIVMVAIGFMIIFRMKIDPKTVISIQAALPKIILTLVLITFSYAIVGFLIDIMYLSMAIIINLMAQAMGGGFAKNVTRLQTQYMTGGLGTLAGSVFSGGFRSLDDLFEGLWGGFIGTGGIGTAIGSILNIGAPVPGLLIGALVGTFGISLLAIAIIFLGLLFTFIRLLFLLFNSYIQLLIALLLGPILLLREAVPGKSAFSGWILNIMANLVVFPATVAVLLFGTFLTSSNIGEKLWVPPLIGVLGDVSGPIFTAMLGLCVIFMAPSLVAQIKKAFHPKPAMPVTAGTAFAPLTGAVGTTMGAASQFYYLQYMPGISRFFKGGRGGGAPAGTDH